MPEDDELLEEEIHPSQEKNIWVLLILILVFLSIIIGLAALVESSNSSQAQDFKPEVVKKQ